MGSVANRPVCTASTSQLSVRRIRCRSMLIVSINLVQERARGHVTLSRGEQDDRRGVATGRRGGRCGPGSGYRPGPTRRNAAGAWPVTRRRAGTAWGKRAVYVLPRGPNERASPADRSRMSGTGGALGHDCLPHLVRRRLGAWERLPRYLGGWSTAAGGDPEALVRVPFHVFRDTVISGSQLSSGWHDRQLADGSRKR